MKWSTFNRIMKQYTNCTKQAMVAISGKIKKSL
jgi:hypothetical protein